MIEVSTFDDCNIMRLGRSEIEFINAADTDKSASANSITHARSYTRTKFEQFRVLGVNHCELSPAIHFESHRVSVDSRTNDWRTHRIEDFHPAISDDRAFSIIRSTTRQRTRDQK
ncbi:hypothetical protein GWA01_19150 [Gluconobacter wancherniae NBRC 103581]|uniref:Uncharacterized protein n=1 Tax=Gluconobacter wancherniae NBRC 103581 TaxID=656744 RepID=A0A511B111_9PROT|nr:hypothetical protein GWA01_19150 [Gluconobacter wancherniae NBRC 103581]